MFRLAVATFLASVMASAAFAQPAAHIPPYPRIENTIGYKVEPAWQLEKPPGGEWNTAMSSVAIGADGNVWTFNRGKIPVQVYSQDGKLVRYWRSDIPSVARSRHFSLDISREQPYKEHKSRFRTSGVKLTKGESIDEERNQEESARQEEGNCEEEVGRAF